MLQRESNRKKEREKETSKMQRKFILSHMIFIPLSKENYEL
jgi:hypothetical protein